MGAEVQLYASMGEQPEQTNDSHYGASVSYTIAGLNVVGAYHQFRHGVGGLKRAGLVNVGYDFGAANVVAHYTAEGNGAIGRHKAYGVDVTVPMGAVTLDGSFALDRNFAMAGDKAKVASVQATYALSKRTKLYTLYTWNKPSSTAATNILRAGVRHDF
jgi:predicted porin